VRADTGRPAPDELLWLQRTSGNQAVQRWLAQRAWIVQRDEHDSPTDFIAWIQARPEYTARISSDEGQCAPAAQALGAFLAEAGFTVAYRGILLFPPAADRTALNRNHFVVVVTIGDQPIVVDPTQGQFLGGAAQVAADETWQAHFVTLKLRVPGPDEGFVHKQYRVKYQDSATYAEANAYAKRAAIRYDAADGTALNGRVECVLF
jgi:hypothetical protein